VNPKPERRAACRNQRASAGSVCKRRDAVTLGRNEELQLRASERPATSCSEELGSRSRGAEYGIPNSTRDALVQSIATSS
jgi:hypothetical protein